MTAEILPGGEVAARRSGRAGAGRVLAPLLATLLLAVPGEPAKKREPRTADDLLIVDCLLPAKVRRLGRQSTYLAPRQPIRTTTLDCRVRGGEYTEPDQATYATALAVWLPQAKAGDAEAQFHVGQIFERGLGVTPDYQGAAEWYGKAAEQGNEAAQINLGSLYEQGLGVEKDEVAAMNWYRRAAGLAEDLILMGEAEYEELLQAKADLEAKTSEADELEREVEELRRQVEEYEIQSEEDQIRQETLASALERLESQLERQRSDLVRGAQRVAKLEKELAARPAAAAPAAGPVRGRIDYGRYYALVIGNQSYGELPDVPTAVADARRMAKLLESRYGFEVELLLDATRYETMTALNTLRESLTERDNLLVYYAGHGARDESGDSAFWQPVDAEPDNPANWIPSQVVTEHLDLVPAKHVFVVADAAFSGLRTRAAIAQLPRGMSDEQRFHHIRTMLEKRARLVLTSGEAQPSPAGDDGPSRFSGALLDILEANDGVLEASKVYQQLVERYSSAAAAAPPEFATMRWARNNVADFFFVPES